MTEGRRGRSLIWRLLAALDPEEPGLPKFAPTQQNNITPETNNQPTLRPQAPQTIIQTNSNHLIPPNDKLLVFRALTGIDNVPTLTTPHHSDRSAPNVGFYARVVSAEEQAAKRYRFFSILMNTCLGIQVVAAAAVTALGAASGPHSAVTAFGALNTIMAGILTYLNGSGLPDRLKHYKNEWRNIREYVEQRERELCLDGCELDVQEELLTIERMYEGVKREIEATKSGESPAPAGDHTRRSFFPSSHNRQRPSSPVSENGAAFEK